MNNKYNMVAWMIPWDFQRALEEKLRKFHKVWTLVNKNVSVLVH